MAVAVDYRLNIGPDLIKRGVNKSFQVRLGRNRGGGHAFEREFHDVAGLTNWRFARERGENGLDDRGGARNRFPESVNDPFGRQDTIGSDEDLQSVSRDSPCTSSPGTKRSRRLVPIQIRYRSINSC